MKAAVIAAVLFIFLLPCFISSGSLVRDSPDERPIRPAPGSLGPDSCILQRPIAGWPTRVLPDEQGKSVVEFAIREGQHDMAEFGNYDFGLNVFHVDAGGGGPAAGFQWPDFFSTSATSFGI